MFCRIAGVRSTEQSGIIRTHLYSKQKYIRRELARRRVSDLKTRNNMKSSRELIRGRISVHSVYLKSSAAFSAMRCPYMRKVSSNGFSALASPAVAIAVGPICMTGFP